MTRTSRFHLRLLSAGGLLAIAAPSLSAQTVIDACYVDKTGVLYLIDPAGTKAGELPQRCVKPDKHVQFSWVDANGADHGALTGRDDDDHPQYLLVSGARALTGNLDAGGNKVTGLAVAATGSDAVRLAEAVVDGDAAAGDLSGTFPNPTVVAIRGQAIADVAPTAGQLLGWDDASSSWKPVSPEMVISKHSGLTGLDVDDHTQYLLADGVRASTNGFAVTGTPGSGVIPVTGGGARVMWYPKKAAFRAGRVTGNEWDDANIGAFSVALGDRTVASGETAFAVGVEARATGSRAIAIGNNTVASGRNGVAIGVNGTSATGLEDLALGNNSVASGWNSVAIGLDNVASGRGSMALGSRASTNGKTGAFVYGDFSTSDPYLATGNNQFLVRAVGGVGLNVNNPIPGGLSVAGTIESRSGGVRFPDGTTQTTAASSGVTLGFYRKVSAGPIPAGVAALATIPCDAGDKATGGGTWTDAIGTEFFGVDMKQNGPVPNSEAWLTVVVNGTARTLNVEQFVICADTNSGAAPSVAAFGAAPTPTMQIIAPPRK